MVGVKFSEIILTHKKICLGNDSKWVAENNKSEENRAFENFIEWCLWRKEKEKKRRLIVYQ